MANGLGATLAALIVSTQPLLTTLMATFVFANVPKNSSGLASSLAFGSSYCFATIYRRQRTSDCHHCMYSWVASHNRRNPRSKACWSFNQPPKAILFRLLQRVYFISLVFTVENPEINWNETFLIALAWQIIAVSAALLDTNDFNQKRQCCRTTSCSSWSPVTAIIAFFVLGEPLATTTLCGFLMASFGTC